MADFTIEGMRELEANLGHMSRRIYGAAREGLSKAAMNMVADAQENLRANGTNNTGVLSNTGKVEEVRGGDAIDAGFIAKGKRGYAEYVEYGRRAGKMPPVKNLEQWAYKKLRVDRKASRGVGYLIARKIAKKGTSPQPFFRPAVEKNRQAVSDAIAAAVSQVTGR